MGMNSQVFQANPVRLDVSRSKLDLSHRWQGTGNVGKLIPYFVYTDVLPGDSFKIGASVVIRTTTPIAPVMDDLVCDEYFFFVPHKLTLSRRMMSPDVSDSNYSWKAFIGAQDSLLNMPTPSNDIKLPICLISGPSSNNYIPLKHSLADYLGLPFVPSLTDISARNEHLTINALGPLAYYSVWNDYFRDENLMSPITYSLYFAGNGVFYCNFSFVSPADSKIGLTESVLDVCRFHGYFGSALPWPQRNSETLTLPLSGDASVVSASGAYSPLYTTQSTSASSLGDYYNATFMAVSTAPGIYSLRQKSAGLSGNVPFDNLGIKTADLSVDLSTVSSISVNQFRAIFQTQRWYEALARGGNRIGEMTKAMFGVTPHDLLDDRPEYLGGRRFTLNQTQVANTAGTAVSTETQYSIGSTGAYSLTTDRADSLVTKSFDTWGTIIGVICVRTKDRFHQGINPMYSRSSRFDFYWPQFANLGETAVLKKSIYASGTSADDEIFGYQEAWADYRFFPDITTGALRPGDSQAYWNYCTNFSECPTLKQFISGSDMADIVDRTLQVPRATAGFQFMIDAYFDITAVRPMPLYSIPGLVDHH